MGTAAEECDEGRRVRHGGATAKKCLNFKTSALETQSNIPSSSIIPVGLSVDGELNTYINNSPTAARITARTYLPL